MPKVTQKGQVTIPRHIRHLMGIKAGDDVFFEIDQGKVILKKKVASIENLKKYRGFLRHLSGKNPDEIMGNLRGSSD